MKKLKTIIAIPLITLFLSCNSSDNKTVDSTSEKKEDQSGVDTKNAGSELRTAMRKL